MTDNLLGYADIAAATGISVGALRKRLHTGGMPPPTIKIGGSPYWDGDGPIRDWIDRARPGVSG